MKKCKICGKNEIQAKGMCIKHYQQYRKYGKVLDNNPRTQKNPNEIIKYEDYAEIILYNNKSNEVARALIDLEDIVKVKDYKWYLNKCGYVFTKVNYSNIRLHRLIMDSPDDMVVDHINHNQLDNRKLNLRTCTQQQNCMNASKRIDNTSGTTGVCFDKRSNKWNARIIFKGKCIHLGYFNAKEEAVKARQEAEIKYFGKYRNQG